MQTWTLPSDMTHLCVVAVSKNSFENWSLLTYFPFSFDEWNNSPPRELPIRLSVRLSVCLSFSLSVLRIYLFYFILAERWKKLFFFFSVILLLTSILVYFFPFFLSLVTVRQYFYARLGAAAAWKYDIFFFFVFKKWRRHSTQQRREVSKNKNEFWKRRRREKNLLGLYGSIKEKAKWEYLTDWRMDIGDGQVGKSLCPSSHSLYLFFFLYIYTRISETIFDSARGCFYSCCYARCIFIVI